MTEGVDQRPEVAGKHRVDDEETRDRRRRPQSGGEAALDRKQTQQVGEDQLQDHAPDEGRRRHCNDGADPADMIADPPAIAGGEDADRNAENHHHQAGGKDQFERRRQILRDVDAHRPIAVERVAEIAARDVADVMPILDGNRLIEMALVAERLNQDTNRRDSAHQCGYSLGERCHAGARQTFSFSFCS